MRKTSQDSRTRRAAAAVLCLLFPLWLGSCAPLPVSCLLYTSRCV
ncbi:hypothetical protein [Arthrobacter sp. KBS0703]|nr:hypothetical protein [Arthrobacter sp. KBS0703]